jgi:hypothetical protein
MVGVEEKETYQGKGGHQEKRGYQGKGGHQGKHNVKKIRRKSQREEKIVLCKNGGKLFKQLLIYYIIISVR